MLRDLGDAAAVAAREGERQHPHLACGLQAAHHARGLSRGGDSQGHVLCAPQEPNLPGEDEGEVAVVADRGQGRRVGSERQRRQRPPLLDDGMLELHGHVLCVTGRSAVSHRPEASAFTKASGHLPHARLEPARVALEERGRDPRRFGRLAEDALSHPPFAVRPAGSRCRP